MQSWPQLVRWQSVQAQVAPHDPQPQSGNIKILNIILNITQTSHQSVLTLTVWHCAVLDILEVGEGAEREQSRLTQDLCVSVIYIVTLSCELVIMSLQLIAS